MKSPRARNPAGGDPPSGGTPRGARILIVDDDPVVAECLSDSLSRLGHATATAHDADAALTLLARADAGVDDQQPFDAVLCDACLPIRNGMDLLRDITRLHPGTAVVMLTGYGTVESAVEALRLGACDYLTKPLVDEELNIALARALRQRALLAENVSLRSRLGAAASLEGIVGGDPRMTRIYELVDAVAPSKTTVLMQGESGTGKSLLARAIHDRGPRRDRPFVELSCGSIPETLLESELFGHVKGAFTGAHADNTGRFLAADGGTIFLDEINSASPGMQLKLLRVLQERRFEPVGSTRTVEVDARVILASNQPLERLVAEGLFRHDLYYRINVVKIDLPPLRERVGDIEALAGRFLARYAAELKKQLVGFSEGALDALKRYPYPGNVRELQNIIERAAVLAKRPTIHPEDLPAELATPAGSHPAAGPTPTLARGADAGDAHTGVWAPMTLEAALRGPERLIITRALAANDGNRQKTADVLGINRTTLYKKMKSLGLLGNEAA